ncbi:MAG TPA: hypothetical protein VF099_01685 [Ktedonobacterales bacterium]
MPHSAHQLCCQQSKFRAAGLTSASSHPNYIWLHASDSPALLASIRAALTSGPLQLASLNDRRAMIAQLERDPLYLTLTGVLALGMMARLVSKPAISQTLRLNED